MTLPHPPAAAFVLAGLHLLAAAAPAAGPPAPASPPNGSPAAPVVADLNAPTAAGLLDSARDRLARYRTVRATLKQRAELGGERFELSGALLLADRGRVRLDLAAADPAPEPGGIEEETPAATGLALSQVCDGEVLHTSYRVAGRTAVTRRNVRTVREAAAGAAPDAARLATDLSCGGLAGLLASLRGAVEWEPPRVETVAGRRFAVLSGPWTAEARAAADERAAGLTPDGVTVLLDADRLFPHRFQYWTLTPSGARAAVMTLDLSEVTVNEPVAAGSFVFALPEGVEVEDLTAAAVARVRAAATPPPEHPSSENQPPGEGP